VSERALLVGLLLAACGNGQMAPPPGAGLTAATALAAAIDRAATVTAPWRCARPRVGTGPALVVGERTWRRDGAALSSAAASLTIAAVADARGGADPRVHERLRALAPSLVIAVGGMGTTEAELSAALGAIVDPTWLTVAVPGTTEAWPVHRATVAALAASGAAIVDGSDVRTIDAGVAVIATLPGLPYPARLAAGSEGCSHGPDDVRRIVAELTTLAGQRPTVLVSAPAPQGGVGDLTAGGVHAGDPELTTAAAAVGLVIHAPLDGAPIARGQAQGGDHDAIAAGSLDAVTRYAADGARLAPSITVVTFDRRGRAWRAAPVDPMVR